MKKLFGTTLVFVLLLMSSACGLKFGTDVEPPDFHMDKPGNAYFKVSQIPDYNGTILGAHIFRSGQHTGEIASLWAWPVGGLDVGLLGARLKLFGMETGAGTLFFQPEPLLDEYYGVSDEIE